MPRHNQERSRFVTRFSEAERREPKPRGKGSRHWSLVNHRKRMDETEVLSVRSVEELQDFVGRY